MQRKIVCLSQDDFAPKRLVDFDCLLRIYKHAQIYKYAHRSNGRGGIHVTPDCKLKVILDRNVQE